MQPSRTRSLRLTLVISFALVGAAWLGACSGDDGTNATASGAATGSGGAGSGASTGTGGSSATGTGGTGGSASKCAATETECSGVCIDTQADAAHCGACGKACGATSQCKAGLCEVCPLKFATQKEYGGGMAPFSVALHDMNGDGKRDLVVANAKDGTVSVLLGKGDGTLLPKADFTVGDSPRTVVVGDVNGDGTLDLATANFGYNGAGTTVSVLLGKGDGTFLPKADTIVSKAPLSVALGDVNGDGVLDLVTAHYFPARVSVLLGKGDGTFVSKSDYPVGSALFSVVLGDIDADGKLDLAAANYGNTNAIVLLGKGDGTFGPDSAYPVSASPYAVALGDVNADGKLDLAAANYGTNGGGTTVSVLLGKGDGTFLPKADHTVGDSPQSVVLGDVNGDGTLDLATANAGTSTVSVLLGKGDGTFLSKSDYPVGSGSFYGPFSVALGDMNGDGTLDLATANGGLATVSVLLNAACTP